MKNEIKEEEKVKKLTKEQRKDLKTKEKFKEIEGKFKKIDKLLKLATQFEEFRNKEFETLKENLYEQIDGYVSDKASEAVRSEMINAIGKQYNARQINELEDDLRKDINEKHSYQNERLTKQAQTHRLKIEQIKLEFQKVYRKNDELKSTICDFLTEWDNLRSEATNIYDSLEPRINELSNDRMKIEKKLAKTEFILLGFIGLNFGLTIFLLINFFTVFDF